jgi:hypothetical protein
MGTLAGLRSFVGSDGFGRPPGRLLHVLMLPDDERVAAIGKAVGGTEQNLARCWCTRKRSATG